MKNDKINGASIQARKNKRSHHGACRSGAFGLGLLKALDRELPGGRERGRVSYGGVYFAAYFDAHRRRQ